MANAIPSRRQLGGNPLRLLRKLWQRGFCWLAPAKGRLARRNLNWMSGIEQVRQWPA